MKRGWIRVPSLVFSLGSAAIPGILIADPVRKVPEHDYKILKLCGPRNHHIASYSIEKESYLMDLRALLFEGCPSYEMIPEEFRKFAEQITSNYKKNIRFAYKYNRDEVVYYSSHWTKKESVLRISAFKSMGSSSDLTAYLGRLSNIPTYQYGIATYQFTHKGRQLEFEAPALKSIFSLRKLYWSNAAVYYPETGAEPAADMAIILISMPIYSGENDYSGIYAVYPSDVDRTY